MMKRTALFALSGLWLTPGFTNDFANDDDQLIFQIDQSSSITVNVISNDAVSGNSPLIPRISLDSDFQGQVEIGPDGVSLIYTPDKCRESDENWVDTWSYGYADQPLSAQVSVTVRPRPRPFECFFDPGTNEHKVAQALTHLCMELPYDRLSPGLQERCRALIELRGDIQLNESNRLEFSEGDNFSHEAVRNALLQPVSEIASEEVSAQMDDANRFAKAHKQHIQARLNQLRQNSSTPSDWRFALAFNGENLPLWAALGEMPESLPTGFPGGFSFFLNTENGSFSKETTQFERGFDSDSRSVVLGGDFRFNPRLLMGIAFERDNNSSVYAGQSGALDSRASSATLYASYNTGEPQSATFADFFLGFGEADYDMTRRMQHAGLSVLSEPQRRQVFANFRLGHDFGQGALTWNQFSELSYVKTHIDAYQETGSLGVSFDERTEESLSFNLGVQAMYAVSTRLGAFTPQARFTFHHQFSQDQYQMRGSFEGVSGSEENVFELLSNPQDTDYASFGVGAALQAAYGISFFGDYEIVTQLDYTRASQITLGVRWEI